MIRLPPRSTQSRSSAASDVYKRQLIDISGAVDETILALALDSALRRGLTFIPLMRCRLAAIGTQGRRGMAAVQDLLSQRERSAGLVESPLEIRVERVLRRH